MDKKSHVALRLLPLIALLLAMSYSVGPALSQPAEDDEQTAGSGDTDDNDTDDDPDDADKPDDANEEAGANESVASGGPDDDDTAEPHDADDSAEPDDEAIPPAEDMEPGLAAEIANWHPVPMNDDEHWAPDIQIAPEDYAIPLDTQRNPTGVDWQVVELGDDGDYSEARLGSGKNTTWEPGDMPVVSIPRPGARPTGAGLRDVPYSTGGKPIRATGAPWQAQIYYPKQAPQWAEKRRQGIPLWQLQHYCGGTLIEDHWVLTAAHCIDEGMVRAGYRVRLGSSDISKDEGLTFKIERIVRHSQYAEISRPGKPNMYSNDIALIRIAEDSARPVPRDPTRIHPIPLSDKPVPAGLPVSATGWGKTHDVERSAYSAVLMRVDLRVMDTERCKNLPDYGPAKISSAVICAADDKKSTCRGDSGGGLTNSTGAPTVIGVVSWGKTRCNGDGNPAAYTRVEAYKGWIRQAMALPSSRNSLP